MTTTIPYVPETPEEARQMFADVPASLIGRLSREQFLWAWNAIAYLHPELHPDSASEWPDDLRPFAEDAWRRSEKGELSDEQLYPSDAQWCGLCDRIAAPTVEESTRRMSFVRRPMIRVGDIVRFRRPFPDEVNTRMEIIEWNIDRGLGKHLNTGMNFPPVSDLRFRDIEAVGRVNG